MCCHVVVTTVLQRQPESCVNKGQPQPKEKKLRQCRPPASNAAIYFVPLAFDVYGWEKLADKVLGRRRLTKQGVRVATRNTRALVR